jgi:hypothetical protein
MKLEQLKPAEKRRLENHLKVEMKLTKKSMTMKDLKKTSGIERGQLNYWEFQNVLPKQKTARGKSWRRFSRFDLMGFAIIKELAKHGLYLIDLYENPVERLATEINKFNLIEHFSNGNRIYLCLNGENIDYFCGDDNKDWTNKVWKQRTLPILGPVTIIRIDPIMRYILRKTKRKDFYVKFTNDKFGRKLKIIYYVEEEGIVLGR